MSAHEEDGSTVCKKCGQTFDVHEYLSPRCNGESAPDLRAEVLAGIDLQLENLQGFTSVFLNLPGDIACIALRHLREIAERHVHEVRNMGLDGRLVRRPFCEACNRFVGPDSDWCPTLLSLAPDYAPQALAKMQADRGQ